jgi:hypothetical protein
MNITQKKFVPPHALRVQPPKSQAACLPCATA